MIPLEPAHPNLEQIHLSKSYLEPFESELKLFWTYLRSLVDKNISQSASLIDNKPYPYGQCYTITVKALNILQTLINNHMQKNQSNQTLNILIKFLQAGGKIDRIWGDLRGEYFQNALRVGHYYVDLSNDTVDSSKAPVEILPFEESGITPIRDFEHFADLGSRYWKRVFYANTIFPSIAPFFPLLSLDKKGVLQIEGNDYTIALSSSNQFAQALKVLEDFPKLPKYNKEQLQAHFKEYANGLCLDDSNTKTTEIIQKMAKSPPSYLQKLQSEAVKEMESINRYLQNIKLTNKGAI